METRVASVKTLTPTPTPPLTLTLTLTLALSNLASNALSNDACDSCSSCRPSGLLAV